MKGRAGFLIGVALAGLLVDLPQVPVAPIVQEAARGRLNVVLFLTDDQTMKTLAKMPYLSSRSNWNLASNIDIAPTIQAISGAEPTLRQDGINLLRLIRNPSVQSRRQGVLLAYRYGGNQVPKYWGVRTRKWKYIELATGEKELYDLTRDRVELSNRALWGLTARMRRLHKLIKAFK